MTEGTGDQYSSLMIGLWWAGAIVLGLALLYGVMRAGNLRRGERERLDRNTVAARDAEERSARSSEPQMGWSSVPYAIIVPIVIACLAIGLMIWSMQGTSGPANQEGTTTGRASGQAAQTQSGNQEPATRPPVQPGNDPGSDSARGNKGPLTKRP